MPARIVQCPNCGGTVEFKAGTSLLSVCPYCSSAVARVGDDIGELEILGRVAPLADLGSPLALGSSGQWGNLGFTLLGQVQYDHGAGPWNEWYATFDDGRWGWVAEAQGKVYITFGQSIAGLPSWTDAEVGGGFTAGQHELTIVERKTARFVTARGEVPFAVVPGAEVRYADAEGPRKLFATLDYNEEGQADKIFIGQELDYEQLFDAALLRDVPPTEAAAAVALNCPHCGAGLEVMAPDESKRIICGTCNSLLDCEKGTELFLLSSATPRAPDPLLPLGKTGKLRGGSVTVYGQLVKSVEAWGEKYLWTEYLLREGREGWRWLVESDGHWSFVVPVSAGEVSTRSGRHREFEGQRFLRFSSGSARVEALRGEFYWKVAVGDRVSSMDFIKPPRMVSEERTSEELVYSLGAYVERDEVAKAFGTDALPASVGVAPHQPNVHTRPLRRMIRIAVVASVLLLLLAGSFALGADEKSVATVESAFVQKGKATPGFLTSGESLPIQRFALSSVRTNLAVRANSDIENGELYLSGKLTHTTSGRNYTVGVRLSHYGGYSGGQAWTSGGRARTVYIGELSSGDYELVLRPEWSGNPKRPPRLMRVEVVEDVFLGTHALVVLVLFWVLPLAGAFRYFGFEKRRWAESDYAE